MKKRPSLECLTVFRVFASFVICSRISGDMMITIRFDQRTRRTISATLERLNELHFR